MFRVAVAVAGFASEASAIALRSSSTRMHGVAAETAAHRARGGLLSAEESARLALADSTAPFWSGAALILATVGGALLFYAALLRPDGRATAERSASDVEAATSKGAVFREI